MRIVFMGTPAFATASLRALKESGSNIVGVVTAPDRAAGRGRKVQVSDVKAYALQENLRLLQPTNLKSIEFIEELKSLAPDLIVVVAFRMLPRAVWELPKRGTINLHASLLPQYRGAAPINWAIINGENQTGVTTFYINENIDTGDLIMQSTTSIDKEDNAGTLHDKLMMLGASLLLKTVNAIEHGEATGITQPHDVNLRSAPKIFKEDTHINWNQEAKRVYDFIRGLSPYPAAYSEMMLNEGAYKIKIYESKIAELCEGPCVPGAVKVEGRRRLFVACNDRWLEITKLQPAGKRMMPVGDFLNGFPISTSAKMA